MIQLINISRATVVALSVLMFLGGSASASETYLETRFGINYLNDITEKTDTMTFADEFKPGFSGEVVWGHKYDNNFRIDTSLAYQRANFDKITFVDDGGLGMALTGTSFDGRSVPLNDSWTQSWTLWLKGGYDFEVTEKIGAYVGAGLGLSAIKVSLHDLGVTDDGKDNASLAYQGLAGAAWKIDPKISLIAEYQYTNVSDIEIDYGLGPGDSFDIDGHTIFLGVRSTY